MFLVTDEEECFALRACLVNVFTEPHYNAGDLNNGLAMMAPMGEFKAGDLGSTQPQSRLYTSLVGLV